MATWEDVRRISLALPDTTEASSRGMPGWSVHEKAFAWERPLRRGDLEALGDDAPQGPILCAQVADVGAKEALVADDPAVYFTTPHFNGYPAILMRIPTLAEIDREELHELVVEAWLTRVQRRIAKAWLAENAPPDD